MASKQFYLVGDDESTALDVDVSAASDLQSLKLVIAGNFAIVEHSGEIMHGELDRRPLTFSRHCISIKRRGFERDRGHQECQWSCWYHR